VGKFSPDQVKARIAELLGRSHREEDVMVRIDTVPYGLWLWDEIHSIHTHHSPSEVAKFLGIPKAEAPEVCFTWKQVF
jgi:hypothetical protein